MPEGPALSWENWESTRFPLHWLAATRKKEDVEFCIVTLPTNGELRGDGGNLIIALCPMAIPSIVPGLVRDRGNPGADCALNPELCVQAPITNALVTYKRCDTCFETPDSFEFKVTELTPEVLMSNVALVEILPDDPSIPTETGVTEVFARDDSIDVEVDQVVDLVLIADDPGSVGTSNLIFSIETGPTLGLLDVGVGVDLAGPNVEYTAPSTTGTTSFVFKARGINELITCDPGSNTFCDTATVTIDIGSPAPLISDQTFRTVVDALTQLNLALSPRPPADTGSSFVLSPAVSGPIHDKATSPPDGFGDAVSVAGVGPPLVAAGQNIDGPSSAALVAAEDMTVARAYIDTDGTLVTINAVAIMFCSRRVETVLSRHVARADPPGTSAYPANRWNATVYTFKMVRTCV